MEPHISQTDLDKFYRKELKKSKTGESQMAERIEPPFHASQEKRTIFLCHSHLDKTIVTKVRLLLGKLETELYVDWLDETMPPVTNAKTATTIKGKIEGCHKFLFLATYNGLRSKWCNWELGLAYSSKSPYDYAVLPVQSRSGNWPGNEYLGLYPSMDVKKKPLEELDIESVSVYFPDKKQITFKQWLAH